MQAIDHDNQLHEIVITRRAGRLNDKNVFTSNVFYNLNANLTIAKSAYLGIPQIDPQTISDSVPK
jgi:hypothetical protein